MLPYMYAAYQFTFYYYFRHPRVESQV